MKIEIRVIPRSSKNEVVGKMENGVLKIKLTSAPVDGEANESLIKILAKEFNVKKGQIQILKGKTSKNKLIEINE